MLEEKKFQLSYLDEGMPLIVLGLAKKVLVANNLATVVDMMANTITAYSAPELWIFAYAFAFQVYFDFSGYTDIARGSAMLFGYKVPINFNLPYLAKNISEFWHRWHISLSTWLRDYLYIPLGGNRGSEVRTYVNLMLTMLLGGLWHGAGWTFIIWGGLHGCYLVIHHFWQSLPEKTRRMPAWFAQTLTFFAVAIAWVFFRAESVSGALSILSSMAQISDMKDLPIDRALFSRLSPLRETFDKQTANIAGILIPLCFIICMALPNSIEIMRRGKPCISGLRGFPLPRHRLAEWTVWQPNLRWGIISGVVITICTAKVLYEPSQVFLYFQF